MNKKGFNFILLIIWMVVIFIFSQQPASISDENSHLVIRIFNVLGLNLNSIFGDLANFAVRKGAHFTEYFILYIFMFNVFKDKYSFTKALCFSIAGVFLYACTDEFHQIFVQGRTAKVRDIIIDTLGGLTALTVKYIYRSIKD